MAGSFFLVFMDQAEGEVHKHTQSDLNYPDFSTISGLFDYPDNKKVG